MRALCGVTVVGVVVAGCSSGPAPAPTEPGEPEPTVSASADASPGAGLALPAVVQASETRALTGCQNAVGWLDDDGQTQTASVIRSVAPAMVVDLARPLGPSANETGSYFLTLSGDGRTAAVSFLERLPGGATRTDRVVTRIELFDTTTGALRKQLTLNYAATPYERCFDKFIIFEPDLEFVTTKRDYKLTAVNAASGTAQRTISLRYLDEDERDYSGGSVGDVAFVYRYQTGSDSFTTQAVSLSAGRVLWSKASVAGESTPVLDYQPGAPFVVMRIEGRTAVVQARSGRPAVSVAIGAGYSADNAFAVDSLRSVVYLTDGDRIAATSLKTGRTDALPWARNLSRVGFVLYGAVDSQLVTQTKEEIRLLSAGTGRAQPLPDPDFIRAGRNWAGASTSDGIYKIIMTTSPYSTDLPLSVASTIN